MEHKNYYGEIKALHKQIVEDIKNMMEEHNKSVVDLAGSPAPHAFVVGIPDFDTGLGDMDAEVLSVILEDDTIKFDVNWDMDSEDYLEEYPNWNEDISDLYEVIDANDFEKLVPCSGLGSVYESVYEYLTNGYKGDNDE